MQICLRPLALALLVTQAVAQQEQSPPKSEAPPQQAPAATGPTFSEEQLEQLVAPIALYPDALLAQVLMGATYPLEIVQASRWVQANPGRTGGELEAALANERGTRR